MRRCAGCGKDVDRRFRFCPWCAAPQRQKLVEFFPAHEAVADDRGKALRASRYLDDPDVGPHVRFSIWNRAGEAEAALSLEEEEARRLARFLLAPEPQAREGVAPEDATVVLGRATD